MSLLDELKQQSKEIEALIDQLNLERLRVSSEISNQLARAHDLTLAISALTPAEDAAVGVVEIPEGFIRHDGSETAPALPADRAIRWVNRSGMILESNTSHLCWNDNVIAYQVVETVELPTKEWYATPDEEATLISTPAEESDPPLCTCHPDDAPPECQRKYAASECRAAYDATLPTAEVVRGILSEAAAGVEVEHDGSELNALPDPVEQASAAIDQSLSDVEETGGYPHVGGEDEREVGTSELQVVDTWMTPAGDGRADESDAKMFAYGIQSDEAKKHEAQGWRSLWPLRQKADA